MQPRDERPVIISFRVEHMLGWGVTIFLCLVIPTVLYLNLHPLSTIHTMPSAMLALGRWTGLVGLCMYALNLVYATRLRFLEYWFGGLNRVYIAHHLLGGFALIFLTFHPLMLSLRYAKSSMQEAALMLLPNGLTPLSALFDKKADLHSVVLEQWAITFGIIAFWGLVGLLLVTFFIKIPYRLWLFTHKFLGVAFFLAGLHILFITSDTSASKIMRYYILGLTLIGLIAFLYKTMAGKILIRKYQYFVDRVEQAGGGVSQIIMHPVDKARAMSYKPGQFVFIRFLDSAQFGINKEWHPFTISSSPKDEYLRLSIKGLGDYTNLVNKIPNGARAEIEGAYGKFTYTNYKNPKQIWVAGGIGITPFLSMARELPENQDIHVDLYYSVKTASELVDWEDLTKISVIKDGSFRLFPYIADREEGYLDAKYIDKNSGGVLGKDIFICGPPPMMKSMRRQFKQLSVPGTSIHSEEFAMT